MIRGMEEARVMAIAIATATAQGKVPRGPGLRVGGLKMCVELFLVLPSLCFLF